MSTEVWDELEWAAEKPTNDLFPRLETPPQRAWVKLYRPFTGEDRFLALFQPALSSLNGWTVHPHDLLESFILECQVLTRFKLMLEVEVLSATPLPEFSRPHEPPLVPLPHGTRAQAEKMHYFESGYDSETGAWAVAREDDLGHLFVILSNHWDGDGPLPPAQAGHRPLTPEEQSRLLAFPLEDVD